MVAMTARGGGGAERDLGDRQAAFEQRIDQRQGRLGVVDCDDRHDAVIRKACEDVHVYLSGVRMEAPRRVETARAASGMAGRPGSGGSVCIW